MRPRVCVAKCEIMRLLARRAGSLEPREVREWTGRETRDIVEGKEMKQNHIKPRQAAEKVKVISTG